MRYEFQLRPVGDEVLIYEVERRLKVKVLKLEKDYTRNKLVVEVDRELTKAELELLANIVRSPPPRYEYVLEPPSIDEVKEEIKSVIGVEPIVVDISADGMVSRVVFAQKLTEAQKRALYELCVKQRLRMKEVVY
jgi:hypothetical protein